MLELVEEIPVKFDPNWTEYVGLALTLGSILVTVWLGVLAYRNGKSATEIALGQTKAAEVRAAKEDRGAASLAMFRALTELDNYLQLHNDATHTGRAWREVRSSFDSALVQLDLHAALRPGDDPRDWFKRSFERVYKDINASRYSKETLETHISQVRGHVKEWGAEKISATGLAKQAPPTA
ncbi:hypothetical protein [Leucobacter sp. 1207-22]|uniref:hypothetical protein n=1 Tax=Leucobacter sp. 1207-22 TaxID=2604456 RepID=UPI0040647F9B